ncbi:uncharacterized protein C8R40DRAFT_569216 [Lentinula edodes]|uniref:uncharacterized protein n=1 Tax=Lentinula edodes TaxID=5353 RepID=UPI001E8EE48A|nr:uncharacterized protein C8R40DRAFT_569216 [Lentinula edodes]KAH7871127.1 hypothetical protein C8R40DRAFT_569216 [Lentinula edodes]
MTSHNFRHCQTKDMEPNLYQWCPCTIHESPRQPLPPPTRSRESSLTIRSSVGPPSLAYSHSSGSSDSMRSAPPTPPPIEPYRFKAQANVHLFQGRHRPNDNVGPVYGSARHGTTAKPKVLSVYEPQARKPGHRVFVLARDRDKQSTIPNKPLVRCTPTVSPTECFRQQHLIYMLVKFRINFPNTYITRRGRDPIPPKSPCHPGPMSSCPAGTPIPSFLSSFTDCQKSRRKLAEIG